MFKPHVSSQFPEKPAAKKWNFRKNNKTLRSFVNAWWYHLITIIYKPRLAQAAPAPNSTAAPTAPVGNAAAPVVGDVGLVVGLVVELVVTLVTVAAMMDVAVGTPDVNGAVLTLDTPENAGAPAVAVPLAGFVLFGLRTLSHVSD
jgi:hypothetical protein